MLAWEWQRIGKVSINPYFTVLEAVCKKNIMGLENPFKAYGQRCPDEIAPLNQ